MAADCRSSVNATRKVLESPFLNGLHELDPHAAASRDGRDRFTAFYPGLPQPFTDRFF